MSANINFVVLLGNLCSDVELRYMKNSGEPVANFRLACGSSEKDVLYIPVAVFGKFAETASRYLSKGSSVIVEGTLSMQTWKDRETGKNRTSYSVISNRIQFLSSGRRNDNQSSTTPENGGVSYGGHKYSRSDIPSDMNPHQPPSAPAADPHVEEVRNVPQDDIPF